MSETLSKPPALRFSKAATNAAYDEWGCNCGPSAIAAVLGMTLDELRPHLGDFEARGYTNPTLMRDILRRVIGGRFQWRTSRGEMICWPAFGLARIQWGGPWCAPGVPPAAAYRHTHWVGAMEIAPGEFSIFDVNAMSAGGWISASLWSRELVPWLLAQVEPRADGVWWITHAVQLAEPVVLFP